MAAGSCSSSDPCFLKKQNCDSVIRVTCRVRQMIHQVQCCSTRAKGDSTSACFSAGEVDPQEMMAVVKDLEHAARQLQEELEKHLNLHELRAKRGRAQRAQVDSGVLSWTPDNASAFPIQEEAHI